MKRRILLVLFALSITLTACMSASASELLKPASPLPAPQTRTITEDDMLAAFGFSVELFKHSYAKTVGDNTLISPLSVLLALAMTMNGADTDTLAEMEAVLGADAQTLNAFLFSYVKGLHSSRDSKLGIANSIWFDDKDDFTANEAFLQINEAYYDAQLYKTPFNDNTLNDINKWVDKNTDGLIKEILDEIPADAVMYLINAIIFDALWQNEYKTNDIANRDFTNYKGEKQTARMMYSSEWTYLVDDGAIGFMKPYKGGGYSFAALLPDEELGIDEYVKSLTGAGLHSVLSNAERTTVETVAIPKFKFDYDREMKNVLEAMGMKRAFDMVRADFTKLGTVPPDFNLHISRVLHKTFIEVDELGTKAGAVTVVEVSSNGSSAPAEDPKRVILDRPFVFMIVDNAQNLPVFIGVVNSI
jgi:serpin B